MNLLKYFFWKIKNINKSIPYKNYFIFDESKTTVDGYEGGGKAW